MKAKETQKWAHDAYQKLDMNKLMKRIYGKIKEESCQKGKYKT